MWFKKALNLGKIADTFPVSSKAELIKHVILLGATLIDDGSTMSCITPCGYVWNSNFIHEISIQYERGWKKGEVYYELLNDIKIGLSECEEKECEWCLENGNIPYGVTLSDCIVINGKLNKGINENN